MAENSYCGEGFDKDGFNFYRLIDSRQNDIAAKSIDRGSERGSERERDGDGEERDIDYELVNDDGECRSSDKRLDPSDGEYALADCAAACADCPDGCSYFSYRPGSKSQCYAEYPSNPTAGNSYCGEGFDSDGFDFYRLIDSPSKDSKRTVVGTEGEVGSVAMSSFLAVLGISVASATIGLGLLAFVGRRFTPLSTREVTGKYNTTTTTTGESGPILVGARNGTTVSPGAVRTQLAGSTEESDFVSDAGPSHPQRAEFSIPRFCSRCGARWIDGNRFCGQCGAEGLLVTSVRA